jgi:hypothetical protein
MTKKLTRAMIRGTAVSTACLALLLGGTALDPSQDVYAADVQFYLTTAEPGWKCEGCCYTGYCCDVPIDNCGSSEP